MASTIIDSTVTVFTGWGTQTAGDTFLFTTNAVLFVPNTSYNTITTDVKVVVAGLWTVGGFEANQGSSLNVTQTGQIFLTSTFNGIYLGSSAGATLRNEGSITAAVNGVQSSNGSLVYNSGSIIAAATGVSMNVFSEPGQQDTLVNHGTISAEDFYGVNVVQGGAHITNSGVISALGNPGNPTQSGILAGGTTIIMNSGVIEGSSFGIYTSNVGTGCLVVNSGTITGLSYAFSVNNGFIYTDTIRNTGTMNGAVYTGSGADTVTNRGGTINGNVDLADGADVFDGRGGVVTGYVAGGTGADVYFITDPTQRIIENSFDAHIDLVYATCSFQLDTGLEFLILQGQGDFRGFGNDLGNDIRGNAGDNRLLGLAGADTLAGGLGDDRITGGTMNDNLAGEDGDDTLQGGVGNDSLTGGEGDDVILGGLGRDNLTGGTGADQFLFTALAQSGATPGSADVLVDFTQGDDIVNLTALDAKAGNANSNDSFAFIGAGAFTSVAGQLRAVQSGGFTQVEADVTGDGTADFILRLTPLLVLTAADFAL